MQQAMVDARPGYPRYNTCICMHVYRSVCLCMHVYGEWAKNFQTGC